MSWIFKFNENRILLEAIFGNFGHQTPLMGSHKICGPDYKQTDKQSIDMYTFCLNF